MTQAFASTPSSERTQIAFFGAMNVGKSSLINALTGQQASLVSDTPGTTTDPVKKAMEILPLGPVVLIDTAGYDDSGELGTLRIEKTKEVLGRTDLAVLVIEAGRDFGPTEEALLDEFKKRDLPYLIAWSKSDALDEIPQTSKQNEIYVSAKSGFHIDECKELLAKLANRSGGAGEDGTNGKNGKDKPIVRDILTPRDLVVLVTPIDEAAPKGRLILPQMLVLRECLDAHMQVHICQDTELSDALASFTKKPALVITDSQVFKEVASVVPEDVPLTSFSILFARYKGELDLLLKGVERLGTLRGGDRVLISEGCTHHRQCNDIGTKKLPDWIRAYSNATPDFSFTSGGEFPKDLSQYELIVHCGACMLPEAEMHSRLTAAEEAGVPITNYGMAIAKMQGILGRALAPLRKA